jgi:8-oxo-dGTP diphosphatase
MPFEYEYPRPAVSADLVVVDRKSGTPKLLLIQRLREPFANSWALPGGFMEIDETLEQAAMRELEEETGIVTEEVIPIGAFSAVERDPRGRIITFAFYVELAGQQTAVAADDAKDAQWFDLGKLPPLAFDHDQILELARKNCFPDA